MVATSGIPGRHSKGILLSLHDTSACRGNTGTSRLRDEGMQKCMGGLAEDESGKRRAGRSSGQKLG